MMHTEVIFIISLIMFEFNMADHITNSKCNKKLGLDYFTKPIIDRLPDNKLSASSESPYCLAKYGRLHYPPSLLRREFGVWCPKDDDITPWFQVDFGKMVTVRKVTLATNDHVDKFTKSYAVSYRYENSRWFNVNNKDGSIRVFPGIDDVYFPKTTDLGEYITAQYFRIYPKTKSESYCMQLELNGCFLEKECDRAVGITDSNIIKNDQFSASSARYNHFASDTRIQTNSNSQRKWCPQLNDTTPWVQIDLKSIKEISGLVQNESLSNKSFVNETLFKLSYSFDSIHWINYISEENIRNNESTFIISKREINPTFRARYIRFTASAFDEQNVPCLNLELYECLPNVKSLPNLVKGLSHQTIKRGEKLALVCTFTGQPLIQFEWRKNGKFLTTDERITTVHSEHKYNVTGVLDFERITYIDSALFTCFAWYPGLRDYAAESNSVITVLAPIPVMKVVNVSNTYATLDLSFYEPYTRDMRGYVIKIKHIDLPAYTKMVHVDKSLLNVSKSILEYKLSPLRPYSNYTIHVAISYVAKEFGKFTSEEKLFTSQDIPYGAPLDLHVERLSTKSLGVSWSLPRHSLRNGPIIGFQVRHTKSVEEGEIEKTEYKYLNNTEISLYDLEAGAIYQVAVQAFTKMGPGPYSFPSFMIFTGKATAELDKINKMSITKANAAAVSNRLQNITSDRQYLNKHDIELTIDILEKVVTVENTTDIGESLVKIVSNVLKANKSVLDESEMTNRTGTRYVKVLERWLADVDSDLTQGSDNVMVRKVNWHKDMIEEEIKFAEEAAEIIIPSKIIQKLNKTEDVSVFFVFYKKNKFFKKPAIIETKCINGFTVVVERSYTPVISGEIVGSDTRNLSDPIVFKFKTNTNKTLGDSACVYWDFKANDNKGNWSTKGCYVHSIVGQTIECHCNHLTNFAAMMDIYANTSIVCGHHKEILSYITIFGCFLSLLGLFITFLTYSLFKRLHQELSAKVLVQLCSSLFVVDLIFIIGVEQIERPTLCTIVALTIHYFTLVSFLWMLIEALLMYYSFVIVWPPREGCDIYKSSMTAWGIPFVIVLLSYLINQDAYSGHNYCHVTGLPFYVSYLFPIGLIILVNIIIFMCIMYRLNTRPSNNSDKSSLEAAFLRCRRAFGIMILMGLTWSFGFGLASKARLQFSYLFAITNGLQGFAIFIFYCVGQQNARKAWVRFFMCDSRNQHERNTESYSRMVRLSTSISNAARRSNHYENNDKS